MARSRVWMGAVFVLSVAGAAAAQTRESVHAPPAPAIWRHGTTVNLLAGAAAAMSERGGIGGAAVADTFMDPTIVFGGGVSLFLNQHWAVRPDVHEMVVIRHARSYPVTTFAIQVAYHVEDHPIALTGVHSGSR